MPETVEYESNHNWQGMTVNNNAAKSTARDNQPEIVAVKGFFFDCYSFNHNSYRGKVVRVYHVIKTLLLKPSIRNYLDDSTSCFVSISTSIPVLPTQTLGDHPVVIVFPHLVFKHLTITCFVLLQWQFLCWYVGIHFILVCCQLLKKGYMWERIGTKRLLWCTQLLSEWRRGFLMIWAKVT